MGSNLHGFKLFGIGLCLAVFAAAKPMTNQARIVMCSIAVICIVLGIYLLRRTQSVSNNVSLNSSPGAKPASSEFRYYRRWFWISLIAFPTLTGIVAYQLHELKLGRVKSVQLPWPLGTVYRDYGYWPTVLLIPAVGFICCAVFLGKMRKLR
jgi:hypothetical protein